MLRLLLLLLATLPFTTLAKGLSPYLPLNISPEVETQIERVIALTPGAPLTRPYKAAELKRRLELIKGSHPMLVSRLSKYLDRYTQTHGLTHANVSASVSSGEDKALVNQRNLRSDTSFTASLGAMTYLSPYAYVSSGFEYREGDGVTHTNTHLGLGYEYAQLELGYREHWFSPFNDSAMLVSTHAKPSPSITLSNATPITDWNIRYELFYSQLETVDAIVLGDETFPGKPRHAGLHISFTPFDFWTIGVNRTLQFGGGKRKVTVADFFEALLDPAGKDNVGDVDTDDPNFEFGNQQASVTTRLNLNWFMPMSLYAEYGGEDTVSESNFKLGNQTLSFGIYLPELTESIAMRYEYVDWATRWYVHHLYPDGYTNDGQVMGHWGGGERVANTSPPGSSHTLKFNWLMPDNDMLDIALRSQLNEDTAVTDYQRSIEAEVSYSMANQYGFWGVTLVGGQNVFGDDYFRLTGFYRW